MAPSNFLSTSTEHLAYDSRFKKTCCKMETLLWKLIATLSMIVAFIALIIGIVAIDKANITASNQKRQDDQNYPQSCKNIISKNSGLYTIRPDQQSIPFQVYCDMESAGGGWTLVASVHENNIDGKCTPGDKWSSEQGSSTIMGSSNWENKNVFGQLETITNQDYKNPAYFASPASDVMLWHVPNGNKIYQISEAATLKYRTTSGFLNLSTLQNFYSTQFPLTTAAGGLHPLLELLNKSSATITKLVPGWYKYRYDGGRRATSIRDGGGDMYDSGNRVAFKTDRENFTTIVYNTPYFLYGSGVEVKSSANYPFVTLAWIGAGLGTGNTSVKTFSLKVTSNYGADGRGAFVTYPNKAINAGQMSAQYTAFNVINASDPSICEVFFYIGSSTWNSRFPDNMIKVTWSNTTAEAFNHVKFTGSPSNLIIGYMLLSKGRGVVVKPSEVEAVLKKYMNIASNFKFNVQVPHRVESIQYLRGNNDMIMYSIPTVHKSKVLPGNIQFRAFNSVGVPNALCPGVRVNSDNPERMCIGGTSTASLDMRICGDFAGWAGISGDRGNQTSPSRTGKSLADINSSILIFTR